MGRRCYSRRTVGVTHVLHKTIKMFRVALRTSSALKQCLKIQAPATSLVRHSSAKKESDEEFDARYVNYFSRPDIDGWECRKAMNDLIGEDLIPEPKIVIAAMHACRRLNDISIAMRFLEAIKWKSVKKWTKFGLIFTKRSSLPWKNLASLHLKNV